MHLVGPYLTTSRYSFKNKKSKSKKLIEATAKHDKWLLERGLHPNQRELQKAHRGQFKFNIPDYTTENLYELGNQVGNGYKRGIMEKLRDESPEVQKAILDKAARTMPLYNKGGYQYATPETDMTLVGSRSRRN
jgi:hypothetical protein